MPYFIFELNYFHTQEKRNKQLSKPLKCKKDNAWLGEGYYFWEDEQDALFWGQSSKRDNYEIYIAQLKKDAEILDTVFNREHYEFWIKQIEKFCKTFIKKTGQKPTLKEINNCITKKIVDDEFDGVLFQDIAENAAKYLVQGMQYKKRIQLVLYNLSKIESFKFHYKN